MENRKIILAIFILAASCILSSHAEFKRFKHKPKHDGSLNFLVIGDWGRKGFYNQTLVAHQMGNVAEKLDIDFIVSAGDNFYDTGLTGVNDPAFVDSFSNIYTASSLQTQWYSVLGNYDYRGDTRAQLSKELRQEDKRWLCMRSFMLDAGSLFGIEQF